MNHKKSRTKSHRLWNDENPELKELETKLKNYQKQINTYKKKLEIRRVETDFETKNELIDLERQKQELLDDISVLEKINARKDKEIKKFKVDTEYDNKISDFLDQLTNMKNEYKKLQKQHTQKQKAQKEIHDNLMLIQNENTKLKRQLVDITATNKLKIGKTEKEEEFDKLTKKKDAIDKTMDSEIKVSLS